MSLSFRCFYLSLLAFLFSLSALNAGESLAGNVKEISLDDIEKKVESLSFDSISQLLDNNLGFPVVLEKDKTKLVQYYRDTLIPIKKDI